MEYKTRLLAGFFIHLFQTNRQKQF
jgi:hypothetical protein